MRSNHLELWKSAGGKVPQNWEFKTIEELLEHSKSISVGVMYPGANTASGTPLVRVSDVKNGAIASQPEFCVSAEVDEEYKRTRLNGSELLVTLVGNPGDCVVVTGNMKGWNVARALAVVRLEDITLRSWLRYVLLSRPAKHLIEARLNTTVQKTLNLKDIRELGVPIPPKEEREKITKIIDALENKSLLNRQTNQTLEQMAQAIFKSWFVDFEPTCAKIAAMLNGQDPERAAMAAISGKSIEEIDQLSPDTQQQLRTAAAVFPDELVDSELGEIPKGWEAKTIGEVVERLKPTKRYTKKQVESFGNVPVYEQGADILLGYHNDAAGFTASAEKPLFIFGDHTCVIHLSCENFDISQNVIPLAGKDYPTVWVYYAIQGKQDFQEYRRHWSELIIKEVVTPVVDVANAYSEFVTILYKQKEGLVRENKTLEQVRDSLLPKLLSGELPISTDA
jgi:restriction endonuclease S subunit